MSVGERRVEPSAAASPTWRLVCGRELRDLWIGGKALSLILVYTVLLGIYSYLFASNSELNLLPLKEMVLETVKASIGVGLFICLIIGADSVSGERERATLEGLLLTPVSRRQIAVGKFLAALSPWPVALAIGIPYWIVLSKGDPVLGQALRWGPVLGTVMAPAFAGLGMLVSLWCNSNKTSLLVSLGLFLVLMLPAGLGTVQPGAELQVRANTLQWLNPMAATTRLLEAALARNASLHDLRPWLTTPLVFPVIVAALLLTTAGPALRLDAGTNRLWTMPS